MVKEYRYRKHLRYMKYIIPCFFALFVLAYWAFIAVLTFLTSAIETEVFMSLTALGGILTLAFLAESVFIWYFLGRFGKVSVILNDDEIIYRNAKGEKRFSIGEIDALQFPSIKYTGGWIKIAKAWDSIRLTVVLEGIGDFLKNLKMALDAKGRSGIYDCRKFFNFYKTAAYADQSWSRVYDIFWKLLGLTALNAAVGILVSKASHLESGFIWITLSVLMPVFIYIITEVIFTVKFSKGTSEELFICPDRDKKMEKKVFFRAGVIYAALYILFSLCIIFID
jgi:hypothetical protein